jgi:hypothetical protein
MGNIFSIDEEQSDVIQDQDMPLPPDLKMEAPVLDVQESPEKIKKTKHRNKTARKNKSYVKKTIKNISGRT